MHYAPNKLMFSILMMLCVCVCVFDVLCFWCCVFVFFFLNFVFTEKFGSGRAQPFDESFKSLNIQKTIDCKRLFYFFFVWNNKDIKRIKHYLFGSFALFVSKETKGSTKLTQFFSILNNVIVIFLLWPFFWVVFGDSRNTTGANFAFSSIPLKCVF